jgi:hypothetical protein
MKLQHAGIIQSDGELWKETRRFTFRHLKDFGFGKSSMIEDSVLEELQIMTQILERSISKGENVLDSEVIPFGPAIVSTLWKMVAGVRVDLEDPEVHKLLRIVQDTLRRRPIGAGLCWSFPILAKLFPQGTGVTEQIQGFNTLKENMRVL